MLLTLMQSDAHAHLSVRLFCMIVTNVYKLTRDVYPLALTGQWGSPGIAAWHACVEAEIRVLPCVGHGAVAG